MNGMEFGTFVDGEESFENNQPEFGEFIEEEEIVPGYRSLIKGVSKAVTSLPTFSGPISPRLQEKLLEKNLPTPKTGLYPYVESATEGAAEGAKFGPAGAVAGGIGGTLKEIAKQQDAPQWIQTAAEIAPWLFTKGGLTPKKNQKKAVELLRKQGFTDKEITPLLQGKSKLSMLGKIGKRGPRVEQRLKSISKKFDESYDVFRKKGKDLPLPRSKVSKFVDRFEEAWEDISADQRKIMKDLKVDFLGKPITRASMQDFFHGINRSIYGKGARGNKVILNKLKDPLYEGMEMIDPGASKDFKLLNELNSKKFEVFRKLSPNQLDRLVAIGEVAGIVPALVTGNLKMVGGLLGEIATRQLATELLINPNLQNLSNKMALSLAKNQGAIYEKLSKKFMNELKSSNPAIYKKVLKAQSGQEKGQKEQPQSKLK